MFESLRIRNFRSIRDSGILNLSNVNVFVGANNSGKSSVLYALMLIKMTLADKDPRSVLVTSTPELDLGSYIDFIRGGKTELNLMIEFSLDRPAIRKQMSLRGGRITGERKAYATCQVAFTYEKQRNEVQVNSFVGKDVSGQTILSVKRLHGDNWQLRGPERKLRKYMRISFANFVPIVRPTSPRPGRDVAYDVYTWFSNSRDMMANLVAPFDDLRYIAPIRERIPRYGIMGTMPYSELGPSGQNLMRVLSSSKLVGRHEKTIINELNYWLNTRFKLLKNVHMQNVDAAGTVRTLLADDRKGVKNINLASMGFGISQLVPVIIHVVLTPEAGCLLVEQPEIHLHPSAQADLADLFIENTKLDRQFFIETHSEHFVLRLRRRIAEGRIKPEKVRIFFVEKIRGLTRVRPLAIKPDGHFVEWPRGFFEEGYREALAIAEAAQGESGE